MKNGIIIGVVFVGLLLLMGWFSRSAERNTDPGDIVSRDGLHTHALLQIFDHGTQIDIPSDIGLIGGHNPMHTHDPDGTIHMEYEGLVTKDDIKLGRFFEVWKKDFSSEKVLDFMNGENGTIQMFVNGEINNQFGDYEMQDGDTIEIRYE